MLEIQVPSLGQEDPVEKEMATPSSVLAWEIPIDRGAQTATVHGAEESDTTEHGTTVDHRDTCALVWV